jgi:hypothetical protein
LLQNSTNALEAAIDAAMRHSAAVACIVDGYARAEGDLGNHRQLYGIQAGRTLEELRTQLKAAKRSTAQLRRRSGKMQILFDNATGRAPVAAPAPRLPRAAWRQAVVQLGLDIHKEQGAAAAFSWLLRADPRDDRAILLASFGDALREVDRQGTLCAYWLAYAVAPSAAIADQTASRVSEIDD